MSQASRQAQGDDKRSLLDVALDVHMDCTGAGQRSLDEHIRDVALLQLALSTWEPTTIKWHQAFDAAVKALIRAALAEAGTPE